MVVRLNNQLSITKTDRKVKIENTSLSFFKDLLYITAIAVRSRNRFINKIFVKSFKM